MILKNNQKNLENNQKNFLILYLKCKCNLLLIIWLLKNIFDRDKYLMKYLKQVFIHCQLENSTKKQKIVG